MVHLAATVLATGVAVLAFAAAGQRSKLRKVVPAKAAGALRDDLGALSCVLAGRTGLQTYARRWEPDNKADSKAVVLMVHGMTVHSGIFAEAAKVLNSNGIAVAAWDLYGHGLSGSLGGIPGVHMPFQDWVEQMSQVVHAIRTEWYPSVPLFLYAESFGSVVATAWCSQHPQDVAQLAGVIFAGAPAKLPPAMATPPAPVLAVLKALARLFPLLPLPDDKITDPQHFASAFGDPVWAEKMWADPLVVKSMRLGPMLGSLEHLLQLLPRARAISSSVPVLVMHGQHDTRTMPAGAEELFAELGSSDKQLKLYEGMAHQLLHGAARDVEWVLADMAGWMLQRC